MNLYRLCPEYLVMCVLVQCFLDLLRFAITTNASPLTQSPAEDGKSTINDNIDMGITNILNIMESISSETNDQLVSQSMDDPNMYHITSAHQLKQLNDPEYSRFNCEVQCGVRAAHSTAELKRVQTLLPSISSHQLVVIDCTRLANTSSGPSDVSPVNVDCIVHYTGRLIHVIVNYDLPSPIENESLHTPVILGDKFAETIQSIFDQRVPEDQRSTTSLYLTLDLPIRTLDAADIVPVASNLKYLAISSHSIQTLDALLLQDLHLDYFILDGCHRIQERIHRPQEAKISPLPLSAHRWNCVVIWSFSCPTAGEFELLGDAKTQERLCQRVQKPSGSWQPSDPVVNVIPMREKVRRRTRRSPTRLPTTDTNRPILASGDPWPFFAEKLIQRFEDEIRILGNDVRRDISWYQTLMNLLIGILAFALLILGATLLAFWIFLRQVLRGKVKPVRATL